MSTELENAIQSINTAADRTTKTTEFVDQLSTYDDISDVTNPNTGVTVPSLQKKTRLVAEAAFAESETQINQAVSVAELSAIAAQSAANYDSEFVAGVTSAIKGKSYLYNGSMWACLNDTTEAPAIGNANWHSLANHGVLTNRDDANAHPASSISMSNGNSVENEVKEVESRLLGVGASLYKGANGRYVQNGNTIPEGATHLTVLINGKPEDVRLSSFESGLVADLTENSATIGGVAVTLHRFLNGGYQATNAELATITPLVGELWFNSTDKIIHIGDGVTQGGIKHVNVNTIKQSPISSSVPTPDQLLMFGDTGGIPTISVADDPQQRVLIQKTATSPDDFSVMQINRHANYDGGTVGFVGTAFLAHTTVEPDANNTFEWTGLFVLDNNATPSTDQGAPGDGSAPQNVALYGQALKRNASATWAGCFEVQDLYGASADGAAIGIEVTSYSVGADNATAPQRNGIHVAAQTYDTNPIGAEWGRAFWATTNVASDVRYRYVYDCSEAYVGDSVFHNAATGVSANSVLIRDEGSLVEGIDLSNATYSTNRAIKLASGHEIVFEGTGTVYLREMSGLIDASARINMQNSFGLPSSGNVSTTATSGVNTLPSNPDGFLIIKIDGVDKKIPYYGA